MKQIQNKVARFPENVVGFATVGFEPCVVLAATQKYRVANISSLMLLLSEQNIHGIISNPGTFLLRPWLPPFLCRVS